MAPLVTRSRRSADGSSQPTLVEGVIETVSETTKALESDRGVTEEEFRAAEATLAQLRRDIEYREV